MKTVFSILFFTLITSISFSQNDSLDQLVVRAKEKGYENLKFKNIPIDGSLNDFVTQLENQSFTVIKLNKLDALLKGRFTNEEVHVLVQSTPKTVFGVTVMYEEKNYWKDIKDQYEYMKSMLTSKYGEPEEIIEKFDDSYHEENGMELLALNAGECTYRTAFGTESGVIDLKISTDANLVISYVDAINYMIYSSEAYKDL